MPPSLNPHTKFKSGKATFQFYLGDCLRVLESLPSESISAIVTSPPYNLGIQYRSYDDTIPRGRYLEWTGEWVTLAAAALAMDGSMFLNVGAKPTEPWPAHNATQAVRPHIQSHHTLHCHTPIAHENTLAGPRPCAETSLPRAR